MPRRDYFSAFEETAEDVSVSSHSLGMMHDDDDDSSGNMRNRSMFGTSMQSQQSSSQMQPQMHHIQRRKRQHMHHALFTSDQAARALDMLDQGDVPAASHLFGLFAAEMKSDATATSWENHVYLARTLTEEARGLLASGPSAPQGIQRLAESVRLLRDLLQHLDSTTLSVASRASHTSSPGLGTSGSSIHPMSSSGSPSLHRGRGLAAGSSLMLPQDDAADMHREAVARAELGRVFFVCAQGIISHLDTPLAAQLSLELSRLHLPFPPPCYDWLDLLTRGISEFDRAAQGVSAASPALSAVLLLEKTKELLRTSQLIPRTCDWRRHILSACLSCAAELLSVPWPTLVLAVPAGLIVRCGKALLREAVSVAARARLMGAMISSSHPPNAEELEAARELFVQLGMLEIELQSIDIPGRLGYAECLIQLAIQKNHSPEAQCNIFQQTMDVLGELMRITDRTNGAEVAAKASSTSIAQMAPAEFSSTLAQQVRKMWSRAVSGWESSRQVVWSRDVVIGRHHTPM